MDGFIFRSPSMPPQFTIHLFYWMPAALQVATIIARMERRGNRSGRPSKVEARHTIPVATRSRTMCLAPTITRLFLINQLTN